MTDTFHQDQVKKAQERDCTGVAKPCTVCNACKAAARNLTEYGQALREDMREYAELMGYEYVDGHMDDLGIPSKETDATPECGDANCFDPGCTKPKETDA